MSNPLGTLLFDARSVLQALQWRDPVLVLGYNTAIFWLPLRMAGIKIVANIDGLEWARAKWSRPIKWWLRANEWAAAKLANHLVADHPTIAARARQLARPDRVTMIPYGADRIDASDSAPLGMLHLRPNHYALVVARPEPENSLLEIVAAYCRVPRELPLVVLGRFDSRNRYHNVVLAAARAGVIFPGAIYDADVIAALRTHARLYIHGHTVGGTNPSLVEALASGCPVLAHDNDFNRWVAGSGIRYFKDSDSCAESLDALLAPGADLSAMREWAHARADEAFRWEPILAEYARLMLRIQPVARDVSNSQESRGLWKGQKPSHHVR